MNCLRLRCEITVGRSRAPGLEGRVLAGVCARQQAAGRRRAWAWAAVAAAVAAMITLLVVRPLHRQPAQLPVTAQARATESHGEKGTDRGYRLATPAVAKTAPPVKLPLARRPPHHAAPSTVDTRPQEFPTPRPLSEQERLLVAYVQSLQGTPAASAPAAGKDLEHDLEIPPLTIAAIKIEPLAPLGSGNREGRTVRHRFLG